ncbi:MAG TPA: DUF362 domain-containing protein [Desulfomonilaceae bacterium]|nr:DUF362 domain-containing protein [Desulfomonilaceae bacterium]
MGKVFLAAVNRGSSEQEIKRGVRAAAEAATDFSWLSRGDSVFIKPALNSGCPYPATTSPVAIAAMVELLRDKGAGRVVVGDMSGIEHLKLSPKKVSGSTQKLMVQCGMAKAAQEAGAELHFFENSGWEAFYEDFPISGSHWNNGLMMPAILKEMDHIVLMPRCGRHALAGSTLGLKAAVGYWRTDTRLEYHKYAATFHEKTAEGNTVSTLLNKQRLVISAADKILTTYGPDKGYVIEPQTGLVIASQSVVAHDMVSLAWLILGRSETPAREKTAFNDPNASQTIASPANRYIVSMLGGIGQAIKTEKLIRYDLNEISDDRTLNCAYELFGGRPKVEIEEANGLLPTELKRRLTEMTTLKPEDPSSGAYGR